MESELLHKQRRGKQIQVGYGAIRSNRGIAQ